MEPALHWFATVDSRRARLFSRRRTPGGSCTVDEHAFLSNRWENEHEHRRPSVLGRGPAANAAQHFASIGHEPEEERRRFARDVHAWLASKVDRLGIERLRVFVAPRMLGELRSEGTAAPRLELREGDLGGLRAHELAAHPALAGSATD